MAQSRRAEIRHKEPSDFSDEALLKAFASLTHQMHEGSREFDLRARRDLVQAEILRRMYVPTMEDAIARGTHLVQVGRTQEVRSALKAVGAKRVASMDQEQVVRFMLITS